MTLESKPGQSRRSYRWVVDSLDELSVLHQIHPLEESDLYHRALVRDTGLTYTLMQLGEEGVAWEETTIRQGAVGRKGPSGPVGPMGDPGERGPRGPAGDLGETGYIGPRGFVGLMGEKGPDGEPGPNGPQGDVGPQGDAGPKGPDGDVGRDGVIGNIGNEGSRGSRGAFGAPGPVGPTGTAGPQGDIGPRGPSGQKGQKGDTGGMGLRGVQGEAGPVGPQGDDGDAGERGLAGVVGDPGPKGKTGDVGPEDPSFKETYISGDRSCKNATTKTTKLIESSKNAGQTGPVRRFLMRGVEDVKYISRDPILSTHTVSKTTTIRTTTKNSILATSRLLDSSVTLENGDDLLVSATGMCASTLVVRGSNTHVHSNDLCRSSIQVDKGSHNDLRMMVDVTHRVDTLEGSHWGLGHSRVSIGTDKDGMGRLIGDVITGYYGIGLRDRLPGNTPLGTCLKNTSGGWSLAREGDPIHGVTTDQLAVTTTIDPDGTLIATEGRVKIQTLHPVSAGAMIQAAGARATSSTSLIALESCKASATQPKMIWAVLKPIK